MTLSPSILNEWQRRLPRFRRPLEGLWRDITAGRQNYNADFLKLSGNGEIYVLLATLKSYEWIAQTIVRNTYSIKDAVVSRIAIASECRLRDRYIRGKLAVVSVGLWNQDDLLRSHDEMFEIEGCSMVVRRNSRLTIAQSPKRITPACFELCFADDRLAVRAKLQLADEIVETVPYQ